MNNSYEEHYREKATTQSTLLHTRAIGIDWAKYGATAERVVNACGGIGAQLPAESRHITNLKKEKAWSRQQSKKLPPWMRQGR